MARDDSGSLVTENTERLTAPHFEHVKNEEVVETNLRLGDRAGSAVELRHHHRISQFLLVVSLRREKASYDLLSKYICTTQLTTSATVLFVRPHTAFKLKHKSEDL